MASSTKNVYTSAALGQNKTPSQLFSSFGATGAPGPIAETRVSMFNNAPTVHLRYALTLLWAFIAAMVTTKEVDATTASYDLPVSTTTFDILPRPTMVITIQDRSPETKRQALINAGFAEQSNGKFKYWRGPSTDQAIQVAVSQGVTPDAYAPGNTCSVNGIIAFSIINRLLHHTFRILAKIDTLSPTSMISPSHVPAISSLDDQPFLTESSLDELPEKGYFFAYFAGLLLDDRATSLRILGHHFGNMFGKGTRKVETFKVFHSGWQSLADTAAGKAISHMLFCIDQAVSVGCKLRPVFLAGEYAGCVFYSSQVGVIVGNTFVPPVPQSDLHEGVELLMSHESAINKVVEIINSLDMADDEDSVVLAPGHLIHPRDIHDALRIRVLTPEKQVQLQLQLRKLRFRQELWEPTNARHVSSAVDLICRGEFPSRDIPFNLRLDAVWTKKPIYSVLAAFNVKAPSLRGETGISMALGRDMYSKVAKPGRLAGIPVFAKAHDKALEDYEGILRDRQVWFAHKGADRAGFLKVKGKMLEIGLDTPEGKSIVGALATKASVKRTRDETGEAPPQSIEQMQEADARKRQKLKGFGALGLALAGQPLGDMDIDEEEDPFA